MWEGWAGWGCRGAGGQSTIRVSCSKRVYLGGHSHQNVPLSGLKLCNRWNTDCRGTLKGQRGMGAGDEGCLTMGLGGGDAHIPTQRLPATGAQHRRGQATATVPSPPSAAQATSPQVVRHH